FLIIMRQLPEDLPKIPLALAGVASVFLPYRYFVLSFARYSYYSQVVSELFAVVMWWALVLWDDPPSVGAMLLFAVAGAASYLTWPMWVGASLAALTAIIFVREGLTPRIRLAHAAAGIGPLAALAGAYTARRAAWAGIVLSGADIRL